MRKFIPFETWIVNLCAIIFATTLFYSVLFWGNGALGFGALMQNKLSILGAVVINVFFGSILFSILNYLYEPKIAQ